MAQALAESLRRQNRTSEKVVNYLAANWWWVTHDGDAGSARVGASQLALSILQLMQSVQTTSRLSIESLNCNKLRRYSWPD